MSISPPPCPEDPVQRLLRQSRLQRRFHDRRSLSVELTAFDSDGTATALVSRDVSEGGIGYLSRQPIHGQQTLLVKLPWVRSVRIDITPVWTRELTDGWFLGGARFIGTQRFASRLLKLVARRRGRAQERESLLCRSTIETVSCGVPQPAICRDISPGGLGLVHSERVSAEPSSITLHLDTPRIFRAHFVWCRQLAEGIFLSGWQLNPQRLQFDRLTEL